MPLDHGAVVVGVAEGSRKGGCMTGSKRKARVAVIAPGLSLPVGATGSGDDVLPFYSNDLYRGGCRGDDDLLLVGAVHRTDPVVSAAVVIAETGFEPATYSL